MSVATYWLRAFILLALLTPGGAGAQNTETVNEVIFSITGESYTSRDLALFKSVLNSVFSKERISSFSETDFQDFALSRLADKEAQGFSFKAEKTQISESARKKMTAFTDTEIKNEVEVVARSVQWIELKKNQFEQRERFNVWFDVLKRKYQYRVKSQSVR